MRKYILFFVLLLIFFIFGAFFINAYKIQNSYFNTKNTGSPEPLVNDVLIQPTLSIYSDYSKDSYDKALLSKSVLILYFTSNWCSECIDQEEINKAAFDEINTQDIVFLKIHILDSETTTETNALAKKFDVTKEQTIVIINKSGAVGFKNVGLVEKEALKQKILEGGV